MRDFVAELLELENQIQSKRSEHDRLQGAKSALSGQKSEIVSMCEALKIKANKEEVSKEIEILEKEIAKQLSFLNKELGEL